MKEITVPDGVPNTYMPKNYLREIVVAKESDLTLFSYHAVLADLKPLLDDWVPVERMNLFEKACKKYGLFVSKESLFIDMPFLDTEKTIGKKYMTTTKKFCAPIGSNYLGIVHVFVSKTKKTLLDGRGFGWYPLAINGRVIPKTRYDHYKFGEFLGYPKCCIDFFWKYNDHNKYANTLFLPFKNTKKPNFMCNTLTKDSHSYAYHIPCSFDCKNTANLASMLREFIYLKDPKYGQIIDKCTKKIFIVFKERDIYGFEGQVNGNELNYNNCYFLDYALYPAKYIELFKKGNRLKVTDERIIIYSRSKILSEIKKERPETGFMISFGD